jgi:hypothetical protein
MRRILFISSIVLLTGMIKAQNHRSNTLLKWNLTSAADVFTFPALQFAVEKGISKHYSIMAEAGLQAYHLLTRSTASEIQPKGFRATIELRRYFLHQTEQGEERELLTGLYTGLNVTARQYQYNDEMLYRNIDNYDDRYTDTYGVRRGFAGVNGLAGYQGRFKKGKIFYDAYGGLGLGIFSLKEYGKEASIREGYKASTPYDASMDNILGRKPTKGMASFNMMLGLRVGLKL